MITSPAKAKFEEDYLIIRKLLCAGKQQVGDVKLWMKVKSDQLVDKMCEEREQSIPKYMGVVPEREKVKVSVRAVIGEGSDDSTDD